MPKDPHNQDNTNSSNTLRAYQQKWNPGASWMGTRSILILLEVGKEMPH